jgi:hypothetical protein
MVKERKPDNKEGRKEEEEEEKIIIINNNNNNREREERRREEGIKIATFVQRLVLISVKAAKVCTRYLVKRPYYQRPTMYIHSQDF